MLIGHFFLYFDTSPLFPFFALGYNPFFSFLTGVSHLSSSIGYETIPECQQTQMDFLELVAIAMIHTSKCFCPFIHLLNKHSKSMIMCQVLEVQKYIRHAPYTQGAQKLLGKTYINSYSTQ